MESHQRLVWVTGARVHFGLRDTTAPFGGAGMMVDHPQTRVSIEPADRFEALGAANDRVQGVAERFRQVTATKRLPACRVRVLQRPTAHCGLGSGTQLALAVAAALNTWTGQHLPPEILVMRVAARGARSVVGSYGFFHGGLVTDPPSLEPQPVCGDWRVLLLRPRGSALTICGDEEATRFDRLPPASAAAKQHLRRLLDQRIVPAAAAGDFDTFADAVCQFNHGSGMLFATAQGGPYHGPAVTQLIERLQQWGVRGVGQSSWGPTVFAFCRSADDARDIADRVSADQTLSATAQIARPLNRGACCEPIPT